MPTALQVTFFAAAALAASPIRAQTAEGVLSTLCADALARPPIVLDLERAEREASALQDRGDPRALELACEAWVVSRATFGERGAETARWVGNLGIGLFTRRRSDEAGLLLRHSHDRALEAGADGAPLARRAAAVLSIVHAQRQQMDDALAWSQRAVATIEPDAPPTQDSLRLRLQHATILSMARRNDEARALYAKLWSEVESEPERWRLEAVGILHQWSVAERRQSRLDEALRINARNIEFQRRWTPEQRQGLALAMHNQGLLLRGLARFDEAEALLREALAEIRSADAPDLFQAGANIRDTLSSLLVERGRTAEALDLAREAVALVQAGPEAGSGAALRPLRRQAEAQAANGEFAGAIDSWRQALAIIESRPDAGDTETRILAWLAYARAMLLLGDLPEAERAADRADAELGTRPSPPDERAERLRLRAAILHGAGRDDEARALLAQADRTWAELHAPEHPQRVRVKAASCRLQAGCDELARLQGEAWPPEVRAQRALALAADARRRGDAAESERQARQALEAAHAAADPSMRWQSLAEYALQQAERGRLFEASYFGKRALMQLQALRDNLLQRGRQVDETFLRDKASLYRRVADWLLAQRRMGEALEVLHLLKRSEQADFAERAGEGEALSLTPAERLLQGLLDRAMADGGEPSPELQRLRELARAQRITPAESQRLADLEQAQAAGRDRSRQGLEAALAAVREAAARSTLPAAAARLPGAPGTPRVSAAAPGELRGWLLTTDRELVALFAAGSRQWVERRPLGVAPGLEAQIAALLEGLQQRRPTAALQRALYERVGRVIDDAARASGSRRLLLWLDGPLRYLPMALLHDGRRHLADKMVITLSGNDLAGPRAASPATARVLRVRALGVTRSHGGLPALPGVADELCAIVDGPVEGLDPVPAGCRAGPKPTGRGPLPGRADADQRFTESGLRDASRGAPVLHIGTHFVLRPGNVSRSWLMLGDGQRLALQQLRALDLGAPRLVTLSACDTALPGGGADGREIDGLAATWLAKGATEVLASLWRVDDRDTARFMQRFYRELARTPADAALALQRTQIATAREGAAVPHWAAFTLLARR